MYDRNIMINDFVCFSASLADNIKNTIGELQKCTIKQKGVLNEKGRSSLF